MIGGTGPTLPVTVVVPALDRQETIERALRSIYGQRPRPAAEVLVIDDFSKDDTAAVAEGLGARVIRHGANKGAGSARNTGIEAATQPWIAFLDSDDEWLPHHLDTLWPLRTGNVVVSSSAVVVRTDGAAPRVSGTPTERALHLDSPRAVVWPVNPVLACTTMMDAAAIREVGGLRTDLPYAEDLDLLLRILERGTGVVSPTITATYHHHDGGKSRRQGEAFATQATIVESYADRPWFSQSLAARRKGVREWDLFRTAVRNRVAPEAVRRGWRIASSRTAIQGVWGMLVWRHQLRRRSREV